MAGFAVWALPVAHAQTPAPATPAEPKAASAERKAAAAARDSGNAVTLDPKSLTAVRVLIQSERETVLSSQMQGKVRQVNAQLGSTFAAGAPLIALDCDEHEARLRSSEAELVAADANLKSKRGLFELKSASELEVIEAEAAKNRAAAQVDLNRTQVRYCVIRAPFSGMVAKVRVKAFENVTANQPLIDIVDQSKLKAQLHVPSNAQGFMNSDAVFKIRIDETGRTYDARLSRKNARVDAASQTLEIEATILTPSGRLTSGMSGTADLTPLVLAEERRQADLRQAAELKAKQDAEAKAKREAAEKAKQEAAEKAKAEKEAKAKAAAEAKAKQEADAKAKREAAEKAKQEAAEKAKAEKEAKAKAAAEAKAKQEADAKAKREAAEKAKQEAAEKAKAEKEAKAKAKAEAKAKGESSEKSKPDGEAKAKPQAQ
jgi:biotin carboxyl carrier protein